MANSKKGQKLLPGNLDLVFSTFIEVSGLITTGASVSRIMTPMLACICEVMSGSAAFAVLEEREGPLRISYTRATEDRRPLVKLGRIRRTELINRLSSRSKPMRLVGELTSRQLQWLAGTNGSGRSKALIVASLQYRKSRIGTLGVVMPKEQTPDDLETGLFELLVREAAIAIKNAREFERTQTLSITDGLTGAYNYRFLIDALRKEIGRSERFDDRFSIIMLDVDGLKEYNDVHGHLRGSEVIRNVAKIVSGMLRSIDMLCKYGGDEFVVILPRTEKDGAAIAAERIRIAIDEHAFVGQNITGNITASMGIASYPEDGKTVEELIASADKVLYRAKRRGRNLVWLSGKRKPFSPV